MRLSLLPIIGSALLFAAQPSMAQSLDPATIFAGADANNDGQVDRAEFVAQRSKAFSVIDVNKDAFLTQAELESQAKGMQGRIGIRRMFPTMDSDGNGKLTQAEFDAAPAPGFDRADTDKNGVVDKSELAAISPN